MKKQIYVILILLMLGIVTTTYSQTVQLTDPFDSMMLRAAQNNPHFETELRDFQEQLAQRSVVYLPVTMNTIGNRGTGANRTIPVVFHIVLNAGQLTQMGGTAGVISRIKSQLDVLNHDFNGLNADTTGIPAAFRPLKGNMNIKFALATKDPSGNSSTGYEFITTTKSDFDANGGGTIGSKYYCSDAKYAATGGANAWDATKYLNIWIINISPTGVGGVGTPPPYALYGGTTQFPWTEQGVAVAYGALGKQTAVSQYFLAASANKGRVLVHELGHFFNLFHPFGRSTNNNSDCQDDDGVTDTPPEAGPTQSYCPVFPLTDVCSPASPGVMYVNHMDYEDETCALMFTNGQKARVYLETEPTTGFRYGLFQHPELINLSVANQEQEAPVRIYPNPASSYCNVIFTNQSRQPQSIALINPLGQVVFRQPIASGATSANIDVRSYPKGVYLLQCIYKDGISGKAVSIR